MGSNVTNFCLSCLNDMCFPDGLNSTGIVLIPNKNNPKMLSDLRSITLCNVVYKIKANVGLGLGRPCGLDSTQPIYLRKLRQLSWRQLLLTAHVR